MPDGKILRGVPEGTSKEDIKLKYYRRSNAPKRITKPYKGLPDEPLESTGLEELLITGPVGGLAKLGLMGARGAGKAASPLIKSMAGMVKKGGETAAKKITKRKLIAAAKEVGPELALELGAQYAADVPGLGVALGVVRQGRKYRGLIRKAKAGPTLTSDRTFSSAR